MKLKDSIPQIDDDYNLDTWEAKEVIEVYGIMVNHIQLTYCSLE
ncbi:hypothetical protein AVEN_98725-1, partial [Araneus ventricosus]